MKKGRSGKVKQISEKQEEKKMKKTGLLMATVLMSVGLAACGGNEAMDELDKNKEQTEVAEKENNEATEEEVSAEETEAEGKKEIWNYYDKDPKKEKWEDLTFDIGRVATTNEFPTYDDDSNEVTKSAVAVEFKVENASKEKVYSTYPDQAVLVTNTGEQIDMTEMWESDDVGGEIHEGVKKEGMVVWVLEKSKAEQLEWIKLTWNSSYEDPDGNYDLDKYGENSVKIEIK